MGFFTIEPEASGSPGQEGPGGLPQPTGFEIARARIRTSGFFRRQHPGIRLPAFWSIGVRGEPGRDDMGLTPAGTLVVSQRVLDLLMDFRIGRAVLAQYAPGSRAKPAKGKR